MLAIADRTFHSRLIMGSALYPSPEIMASSIRAGGAELVTVALRRQNPRDKSGLRFWELIQSLNIAVLPNTAGCKTVKEAVTTAQMARELFNTNWIKLEVIGDDYTLQPDTALLVEATRILIGEGFEVLPYTTEDLIAAQRLVEAGCKIVMPWGSYIGSGQGLINKFALKTLRARLPDTILVVDAGLGKPSEAAHAMELGFDAVLVNSAIALARDPIAMASAFADAVRAGRTAYEAGLMAPREMATPSTPVVGTPFWHQA
ncbi:MAG: thiazole synthase [Kiritimatiellae bacterium]|nr:thiazole synthase [Kiritimatiellia bacterium]MCO5062005.1 thiazole synthase [Kiritimatiellia bacterium]MCO5069304.1 thiazole synthase [Kiritimatiellia bacterium]MCO6400267.1 thiazole synthase [Verrucomicrobiota bacterium]